jgi:hypothetical protein
MVWMNSMRLALCGLLWGVASLTQAATPTWEPVRKSDERGGIQTWVRPVEGNPSRLSEASPKCLTLRSRCWP